MYRSPSNLTCTRDAVNLQKKKIYLFLSYSQYSLTFHMPVKLVYLVAYKVSRSSVFCAHVQLVLSNYAVAATHLHSVIFYLIQSQL